MEIVTLSRQVLANALPFDAGDTIASAQRWSQAPSGESPNRRSEAPVEELKVR